MKDLGNFIILLIYLYNLLYAFIYWGTGWGILNIFFPIAILADIVRHFGRF